MTRTLNLQAMQRRSVQSIQRVSNGAMAEQDINPAKPAMCEQTGTRHEPAKPAKATSCDVHETCPSTESTTTQTESKTQSGTKGAKGAMTEQDINRTLPSFKFPVSLPH